MINKRKKRADNKIINNKININDVKRTLDIKKNYKINKITNKKKIKSLEHNIKRSRYIISNYDKTINKKKIESVKQNVRKPLIINKNNKININYIKRISIINKVFFIALLTIFLSIISISQVSALGITPGRTIIDFEPGLKKTVSFTVINSEAKDMKVVFYVKGEYSDFVTPSQDSVEFSADEKSKTFSYEVNLPSKIKEYGRHEIEIIAAQVPKDSEQEGAVVGTTIAVVTQLWVYVPYPGKYVEAEFNILESEQNTTTRFFLPAINRGTKDINKIKAKIDIYDNNGKKIDTIETNEESLESGKRTELYAEWQADVEIGKYKAVAEITYDGEKKEIEKEFSVGEAFLIIEFISVKDFQLGGIAKFTILVHNKWNEDLKDVYSKMIFYDKENEVMADFKSATYDIKAKSRTEITAYWDSAGTKPGIYDGKIILKYGEKTTEKNVKVKITEDSIEIIGLTGLAIVPKGNKLNVKTLIAVLIILVVISNIIWFVVIKKLKKRKKEKGVVVIKK